jgi:hypothetical protein
MVFFAVAHRYAFPHTDYIHYLRRQHNKRGSTNASSRGETDTLFLFDQDHNVVNDADNLVDVEYQPPTVSQLDCPMSVGRALIGSAVPNETLRDIYRMGGTAAFGDHDSISGRGSGDGRRQAGDDDLLISMDQAEGI